VIDESLKDIEPRDVQQLDSVEHIEALQRVGGALATKVVSIQDFAGFV